MLYIVSYTGCLDGVYTRMLRVAFNVSWEEMYDNLSRLSDKNRQWRTSLAGHCLRHPKLTASELILWEPSHGKKTRGRPHATFLDILKRDTGLSSASEIRTLVDDRDEWRATIRDSQNGSGWCPRIASSHTGLIKAISLFFSFIFQ